MHMLFQHLLFISLNLYCTKVHIQYHEYIIIYIMFTIYHHLIKGIMYLAIKKLMLMYSGTLCMKIHLFKITKYLIHCIFSYIICISNNFLTFKAYFSHLLHAVSFLRNKMPHSLLKTPTTHAN